MAKKVETLEVEGRKLQLSNLEKIYYPKVGFTKGQVIDYYIRISPYLLPHLKGRGLTQKRYPEGIHGQHFYEKDAPKYTPEWIKKLAVPRKSGKSDIHYILINDLPSLIWSVNLANIEMHTFLSRGPNVNRPTMLVFDLDPGPPANVLDCAQVALWLRRILDHFNLKSVVKVSGSKGIQLYVPLNTPTTYDATGGFAEALAVHLANRFPDRVVSEMAKDLRAGKVFIDWSQNSEHKTTVCVYSLRAKREEPYVSMPLQWDQLEKLLADAKEDAFYCQTEEAIERAERMGDLFEPVLSLKQKLPAGYKKKLEEIEFQDSKRPAKGKSAQKKNEKHLEKYQAKRNFQKTSEPSGEVKESSSPKALFVIQKHEASHLHYDFRLEMEGVLRSWAVPKGIPTEKNDRRLAMHVEDHPFDYAKFEGVIPEGNYGAGTVMVWDIGTFEAKDGHPVRGFYTGKLPLILNGKKLKGEWVLVKGGERENDDRSWLLIKTGESATPISARKDDQSALTSRTMAQIAKANDAQWISNRKASKKSRKGGFKEKIQDAAALQDSVSKQLKSLPSGKPRFIDPMQCKLVTMLPEGSNWIYEVKLDGYRAQAIKNGKIAKLTSRNEKDFSRRYPELTSAIAALEFDQIVLDGEVVALDAEGNPSFGLLQDLSGGDKKNRSLVFYAFDLLHFQGKDLLKLPLGTRKELLEQLMDPEMEPLRYSTHFDTDPQTLVEEIRKRGLEGVVAKMRNSHYEAGLRTGSWSKMRTNHQQEFVIGGFKGTRTDFQSILVGFYRGKELLFAGKVKSGFTSRSKKMLSDLFKTLVVKDCPFVNLPEPNQGRWGSGVTAEDMKKCIWVKPAIVCQVEFVEWTSNDHLRHSVFVAIREDKKPQDVVQEK